MRDPPSDQTALDGVTNHRVVNDTLLSQVTLGLTNKNIKSNYPM